MAVLTNYSAKKEELIDSGFSWLRAFSDTIDTIAYNEIDRILKDPSPHNAFLVEKNLNALSRSLDKVLSLRSAANELEDKAVRQALEYQLFSENSEIIQNLEEAQWIADQKKAEVENQAQTSNIFSASSDELADGFATAAIASKKSSELSYEGEKIRKGFVAEKWKNIIAHQEALQSRHTQPGHALNYSERGDRVRELLKQELITSYQRAQAVTAGLEEVFNIKEQLPTLNKNGYIDELVMWARKIVKTLALKKEKETVFEHVISLTAPMLKKSRMLPAATLDNAMNGDGSISIDLNDYFPEELGKIRVHGVGLTVDHKWTTHTHIGVHKTLFIRAAVFPPDQNNPYSDVAGSVLNKQPVLLDKVTMTEPGVATRYFKGPNIENIDPVGVWTIRLPDYILYINDGDHRRNADTVRDIKLHLLLASETSSFTNKWGDFWS